MKGLSSTTAPPARAHTRNAEMQEMSAVLSSDAKQFAVKAKDLYHQALLRKYLPWVVTGGVILLVIILRLWLY